VVESATTLRTVAQPAEWTTPFTTTDTTVDLAWIRVRVRVRVRG